MSQASIVTYCVVIIFSLSLITFAILLYASYNASAETIDTPYMQYIAQNVLRLLRFQH